MRITAFIIFNILFWGFVWLTCKAIIKDEKEFQKTKEISNRERLELENTEFDYGHNVNYNQED